MLGYPGVTGTRLPDTGTVNKTVIDGKPYLCVSYEVEQKQVQPQGALPRGEPFPTDAT